MAFIWENIFKLLDEAIEIVHHVASMGDDDVYDSEWLACVFCDADQSEWDENQQKVVRQPHKDTCYYIRAKKLVERGL